MRIKQDQISTSTPTKSYFVSKRNQTKQNEERKGGWLPKPLPSFCLLQK